MHDIWSGSGAVSYPAELSFATLQQTDCSEANHLGRSVAVISQPVGLQLVGVSPPAYSEIDQSPPPSYLEATGQINQPREEESSSIPDQREDDSYKKCEKRISCYCVAGVCLIFASYIIFRAVVSS